MASSGSSGRRLRVLASHAVGGATAAAGAGPAPTLSDGRQLRIGEREREYVLDVLDNEFRTSGNSKYNSLLESAFAERFGAHATGGEDMYAIGHQNGTATMHTALWAAGLRAGDEVIVPPLTMSSTSICVLHNGCVPVFADVSERSFNIDAESIRKVITPRTKAIITVALYGLCPDYDPIVALCKEHNIVLIEDNAECFLGEYKGQLVGTIGDYSSFSFQASKHMTAGEGGMLLVKDQEQADLARRFCCLGYGSTSATKQKFTKQEIQSPDYNRHCQLGWNYRMSELQAAVALAQLERLEELVDYRCEAAKAFDGAIEGYEHILQRQEAPPGAVNTWWAYTVVLRTERPEVDWYEFRELFLENGGDDVYACWKLTYTEDYFMDEVSGNDGVWQRFDRRSVEAAAAAAAAAAGGSSSGESLCPNAEYLQPR
jgi:perosamine synthetase